VICASSCKLLSFTFAQFMRKKKLILISLIFPLLFVVLIVSCSDKKGQAKSPARVKGIPEKAFWIGGVDGGNWYLIDSISNQRNSAFIKVYNDNDGSLLISKKFDLICQLDNQTLIKNLKEQINFFDGEKIELKSFGGKKSCFLK
jgi:hypothetical protein